MTHSEWRAAMKSAGWHLHTVTKSMTEYTVQWRHGTAVKADGTPITIDVDCANAHRRAGTTPPPF